MQRSFIAMTIIALCALSLGAQAAGLDVMAPAHAFLLAHPDVAVALSALALVGDTTIVDPKAVQASLDKISAEVRGFAEKALAEVKTFGSMTTETKAAVDKLLITQGELQAKQREVEQLVAKLEGNGAGADVQHKSLGEQFAQSEQFKTFSAQVRPRGRVELVVNAAITSLTTDADGSAGDAVNQTRLPGILPLPQRRMTVRDLISPGRMDGNTIEYVKETGFTNNAGMVGEGLVKPESTMKLDLVTTTPKVIAHFMKASRQILSDAAQLASVIDQRLRYGLALKEEQQLLNGDGVGQNLLGIIPQASAYVAPFDPAGTETAIDIIRLAFLQSELAEYPSTGVVMNPTDWARIELLKDADGRYIIGNPQGTLAPTLWNRPVVTTQAIAVDKFLAGAYRQGAQLFDRWLARVEIATENEDDFVKNLVTILAEERLALAVYRPEAFIYGDFGFVV